jgi:DNA-binding HxlR family transcriptional regulator
VARPLSSHGKPAKHESAVRDNVRGNVRANAREKAHDKNRGRAHEEKHDPAPVAPELPELDRLIHERIRLGIVSALATNDSLSFNDLKRVLKTTDGNLSVHARKLEEAQYISCVKFFEGRVPRTEYHLTANGRRALSEYLDQMEEWIRVTREE